MHHMDQIVAATQQDRGSADPQHGNQHCWHSRSPFEGAFYESTRESLVKFRTVRRTDVHVAGESARRNKHSMDHVAPAWRMLPFVYLQVWSARSRSRLDCTSPSGSASALRFIGSCSRR